MQRRGRVKSISTETTAKDRQAISNQIEYLFQQISNRKKQTAKQATPAKTRGSLLGFGVRGYLETPSITRTTSVKKTGGKRDFESSISSKSTQSTKSISLLRNSRSTLSFIQNPPPLTRPNVLKTNSSPNIIFNMKRTGGGATIATNIAPITPHKQPKEKLFERNKKNNKKRHGGTSGGVAPLSKQHAGVTPTLAPTSTLRQPAQSATKPPTVRTSTLSNVSSEPVIYSCPQSQSLLSTECNSLLNDSTWPEQYRLYQFTHILTWDGMIFGGINRNKQFWLFSEAIPFPAFGIPANCIIPLSSDFKRAEFELLRVDVTNKPLPENWFRLKEFSAYPELKSKLLAWWKKLTNECIGPLCIAHHVMDLLTGRCLSRMSLLEPVEKTGFESLSTRTSVVNDGSRSHLKWVKLTNFLLYRTYNTAPQVELLGVVSKPNGTTIPTVSVFSYPIRLTNIYEFNEKSFGLPEPYLSTLLNVLSQVNIQHTILDTQATNAVLLQMQEEMGDFIAVPSSCLFETTLDKPGVFITKDSSCYQMTDNVRYNRKKDGQNFDGSQILSGHIDPVTEAETFVAYIAERDSRFKDQVNVLAGFNSQMQLIVPEYPLSVSINQATKMQSAPVEFSKLLQPFVYDRLFKINNDEFIQRLK